MQANRCSFHSASAVPSWAFTGGGPPFADWQVRRAFATAYAEAMTLQDNQPTPQDGLPAQWIPALILIAVGALFFLNNLHIIAFHDIFEYWPVALVAWGIFKVVDQPEPKDKVVGGILIGIGGVLLSINLGFLHMGWGDLWPLILIAVGVLMLTDRLFGPGMGWAARSNRHADWADKFNWRGNKLNESAVFWGGKRVITDPDFQGGSYYESKPPARGLAVARMVGHITYMSDESMREKFGRKLRGREEFSYGFGVDFEVESYLRYRGSQFVGRFDANSYLYITKAMDYFDLSSGYPSLGASLERAQCRFLVISFTSDWLYPSYQSLEIVNALRSRNHDVTYCELTSTYGHDAFLVDVKDQTGIVRGFLARCERELEAAP